MPPAQERPCGPADLAGFPGLAPARLHEIHAEARDWGAALAFALGAAGGGTGPVVLVRRQGRAALQLCAEGLVGLGLDPARLLLVAARDERALLRAGLDAARCPGLAAVVLESWGPLPLYDLTASRRLVLAAERCGAAVLLLRGQAPPRASAAHTRWQIRAAPSAPLAARAPGPAAIEAELLRLRGGPAGRRWQLEWDETHAIFRTGQAPFPTSAGGGGAALSGAVVSLAGLRQGPAGGRRAA